MMPHGFMPFDQPSQIAMTLVSTSITYQSDAEVSDRCLTDINLRGIAIWIGSDSGLVLSVPILTYNEVDLQKHIFISFSYLKDRSTRVWSMMYCKMMPDTIPQYVLDLTTLLHIALTWQLLGSERGVGNGTLWETGIAGRWRQCDTDADGAIPWLAWGIVSQRVTYAICDLKRKKNNFIITITCTLYW